MYKLLTLTNFTNAVSLQNVINKYIKEEQLQLTQTLEVFIKTVRTYLVSFKRNLNNNLRLQHNKNNVQNITNISQ